MNKKGSVSLYMFVKDITLDGGCERVVANMVNEFANYYSNIHIVSNFQSNEKLRYAVNKEVKIYYLHPDQSVDIWKNNHLFRFLFRSTFIYNLFFSIGFTSKLYAYIKKNTHPGSESIIMFHGYQTVWYKTKGIKLIGVDHSHFPYDISSLKTRTGKMKFQILSFMNRKLDIVTALTNAELVYWKMLGKPVYVVPNFIPNIPIKIPDSTSRDRTIVSMGRMNTNQKGFDLLIHAFSKIACDFPEWKLEIFGEGHLKPGYLKLIENYSLGNQAKIKEFNNNPYEIFLNNSIYVMCSRTEGFGMVLAEAMACGMCSISYENTGPSEIIKNGHSGFLIRNGDENKLCETMRMIMNDEGLRQEISKNAQADILNRFSPQEVIGEWIQIFNSIL